MEDRSIIGQLNHRLTLLQTSNKQLTTEYHEHDLNLDAHQTAARSALEEIKENITALGQEINTLRSNIYAIGRHLRDKVSTQELQMVAERIEETNFEERITKPELNRAWNKYTR